MTLEHAVEVPARPGGPPVRAGRAATTAIKVDVRVVAATNRPLEQAVRDGHFRRDLFFRLQVVEIRRAAAARPAGRRAGAGRALPEEVHRGRRAGRSAGSPRTRSTKLQDYHWPGNVRELRNVVERAVALDDKPYLDAADSGCRRLDPGGVRRCTCRSVQAAVAGGDREAAHPGDAASTPTGTRARRPRSSASSARPWTARSRRTTCGAGVTAPRASPRAGPTA